MINRIFWYCYCLLASITVDIHDCWLSSTSACIYVHVYVDVNILTAIIPSKRDAQTTIDTRLIESDSKFTIMIAESTTLSTKCTLCVYVLSYFDSQDLIVEFFDFIEQDGQNYEIVYFILSKFCSCSLKV